MLGMFVACVLFCACAQWWWRRRHMVRLSARVPTFPGVLPVIGHAHKLMQADSRRLFELIKEISEDANKNNGITTVWLKMKPHFVITDPKDAMTALNTCLEKSYIYDFLAPWLGDGLLTAKVPIWLHHRRMINPAFSPSVVNDFQSTFDRHARKLALALGENAGAGPFDASKPIGHHFLEIVYETALGIPANGATTVDKMYATACHRMLQIAINRFLNAFMHVDFIFNLSKAKREQDEVVKILHKSSFEVMEERKFKFNENNNNVEYTGNRFKPFLQLLLELTETKGVFKEKEIREQIDTVILAGQDTSALVLLYTIIMLGSHQEVQDRVHVELREIFGDSDRDVVKEDLVRMKYIDAVINETLRLYPIGCVLARDVSEDVQLTKYTLPAGSSILVSFWGIHHGPHWGPNAEKFRPERWLDPASLSHQSSAFGGFSLGKRMCIGKAYAMMSMKTTLAHLVRRWRVSANSSHLTLKMDFMLRPYSGHHITIEAR